MNAPHTIASRVRRRSRSSLLRPLCGLLVGCGLTACADREPGASAGGPSLTTAPGTSTSTPPTPPAPEPLRDDVACLGAADGIVLGSARDDTGSPAFALRACRLAYVAADGSLRDRDLLTGEETTLAAADSQPARPDRSQTTLAWDALVDGARRVFVWTADAGTRALASPGGQAGEARVFDKDVVFTSFATSLYGDADVVLWEGTSGAFTVLTDGPAQQRFPVLSRRFVAWADFSEGSEQGIYDPNGTSLADIVVLDRASGQRTVRALPGKQAFPMLEPESDVLGYLQWDEIRPEPKLMAPYGIHVGAIATPSDDRVVRAAGENASVAELRPSLRDGTFAWLERDATGLRLLTRGAKPGAVAVEHALGAVSFASAPLAVGASVLASVQLSSSPAPRLTRVP